MVSAAKRAAELLAEDGIDASNHVYNKPRRRGLLRAKNQNSL
jgi:hypothetical protein